MSEKENAILESAGIVGMERTFSYESINIVEKILTDKLHAAVCLERYELCKKLCETRSDEYYAVINRYKKPTKSNRDSILQMLMCHAIKGVTYEDLPIFSGIVRLLVENNIKFYKSPIKSDNLYEVTSVVGNFEGGKRR